MLPATGSCPRKTVTSQAGEKFENYLLCWLRSFPKDRGLCDRVKVERRNSYVPCFSMASQYGIIS